MNIDLLADLDLALLGGILFHGFLFYSRFSKSVIPLWWEIISETDRYVHLVFQVKCISEY